MEKIRDEKIRTTCHENNQEIISRNIKIDNNLSTRSNKIYNATNIKSINDSYVNTFDTTSSINYQNNFQEEFKNKNKKDKKEIDIDSIIRTPPRSPSLEAPARLSSPVLSGKYNCNTPTSAGLVASSSSSVVTTPTSVPVPIMIFDLPTAMKEIDEKDRVQHTNTIANGAKSYRNREDVNIFSEVDLIRTKTTSTATNTTEIASMNNCNNNYTESQKIQKHIIDNYNYDGNSNTYDDDDDDDNQSDMRIDIDSTSNIHSNHTLVIPTSSSSSNSVNCSSDASTNSSTSTLSELPTFSSPCYQSPSHSQAPSQQDGLGLGHTVNVASANATKAKIGGNRSRSGSMCSSGSDCDGQHQKNIRLCLLGFPHLYEYIEQTDLVKSLQAADEGLTTGQLPRLAEVGMGGTYFLTDCDGRSQVVFKPTDEEPFAFNNPHWHGSSQPPSSIMKSESVYARTYKGRIFPGFSMYREVAAYVLDCDVTYSSNDNTNHSVDDDINDNGIGIGFCGVPPTALAKVKLMTNHTLVSSASGFVSPIVPPSSSSSHDIFTPDNICNSSSSSSSSSMDIFSISPTASTTSSYASGYTATTSESRRLSLSGGTVTFNANGSGGGGPNGLRGGARKLGSIQSFVDAECTCEDLGSSVFNLEDVQRIAIFDIRVCNLDRHVGNMLAVSSASAWKPYSRDEAVLVSDVRINETCSNCSSKCNHNQNLRPMDVDLIMDADYSIDNNSNEEKYRTKIGGVRKMIKGKSLLISPRSPASIGSSPIDMNAEDGEDDMEVEASTDIELQYKPSLRKCNSMSNVPIASSYTSSVSVTSKSRSIYHSSFGVSVLNEFDSNNEDDKNNDIYTDNIDTNCQSIVGSSIGVISNSNAYRSDISTPKANMKMNGTNFESNAEKRERVRKAKPSDSSELSGYRVVPIDHGYILPHILRISECSFGWIHWQQAHTPLSKDLYTYIMRIDIDNDVKRLKSVLGTVIPEACLLSLRVCTHLLQVSVSRQLSLHQIGRMMSVDTDTDSIVVTANDGTIPTSSLQRCVNVCIYRLYHTCHSTDSKISGLNDLRIDPFSSEAYRASMIGVVTDEMLDFCMNVSNYRLLKELERAVLDLVEAWCLKNGNNNKNYKDDQLQL